MRQLHDSQHMQVVSSIWRAGSDVEQTVRVVRLQRQTTAHAMQLFPPQLPTSAALEKQCRQCMLSNLCGALEDCCGLCQAKGAMSKGVVHCQNGPAQQSRTTAAPHSVVHVVFLFDVILYHPRDGRHPLHLGLQGTQQYPEAAEAGTRLQDEQGHPMARPASLPASQNQSKLGTKSSQVSISCHALQGSAFRVQGD